MIICMHNERKIEGNKLRSSTKSSISGCGAQFDSGGERRSDRERVTVLLLVTDTPQTHNPIPELRSL